MECVYSFSCFFISFMIGSRSEGLDVDRIMKQCGVLEMKGYRIAMFSLRI